MSNTASLSKRALCVEQNPDKPVYLFALNAEEILSIADISRVSRDDEGKLIGYQRKEVRQHVDQIVNYLEEEDIIFPNAIILALNSDVKFKKSRGPGVSDGGVSAGTIEIPVPNGSGDAKPGWIVDGQQRTLALSKIKNQKFPVPVTAFIADTVDVQRDQFLRINNSKPLPMGLVSELLPEISTPLPPKLAARKIPSALCDLLNQREESPFYGLIRRSSLSAEEKKRAHVTDTSIIKMLQESITSASGCLFPYRNVANGQTDFDGIWQILMIYWGAVKEVFPDAWGKSPKQSRLMHGAGILAMGRLMDRIMGSINPDNPKAYEQVRDELALIAPHCRWTSGKWEVLGDLAWNDVQNVPKHIKLLSNALMRIYLVAKRAA